MVPLPVVLWHEARARTSPIRRPEPAEAMDDAEQVRSYVQAYAWGGPTSALQLHHLRELSSIIRPGDVVVDLACGPGPLLLELAPFYRDVTFIGADLSSSMLRELSRQAEGHGLSNVSTLEEDIRRLPSLPNASVDVVISTSALHHLPDEDSLRQVFRRVRSVLKPGGAFYLFDFALLRSEAARRLFVADVARLAPPLTARDYDLSLQAAFPLPLVREFAAAELPRPFTFARSRLLDFFYFVQTPSRVAPAAELQAYIDRRWRGLSLAMKGEHVTLRAMRGSRHFT
ncbi:MAG: class I SAM-dependent methyltransferase [Acidobacteria bacterium]|nr:class I SAM-dependent methyltransferase [Acidobacteriota bacterium]